MQTHNQNNYLNYNRLRTIRLNNEKDKILITTQDNGKPFPAEPLATIILKMKKRKETISRFELNNLIQEGKKYRYYFFDYLYYRLYVGYRRHNEPARISSCLFLGMICIILFGFLGLFFNIVLNYDWLLDNFTPIQVKGIFVGLGIFSLLHFLFDTIVKGLPLYF